MGCFKKESFDLTESSSKATEFICLLTPKNLGAWSFGQVFDSFWRVFLRQQATIHA